MLYSTYICNKVYILCMVLVISIMLKLEFISIYIFLCVYTSRYISETFKF